jgi:hypothetical protein
MNEEKYCKYCSIFKPFTSFRKEKTCPDGHRGKCKDCERPMRQAHYQKNKEKYKQAYQEFILRNTNYQHEYYLIKNISLKNEQ